MATRVDVRPLVVLLVSTVLAACGGGGGSSNAPPIAVASAPAEVDEGTPVSLDGSGSSDPEGLSLVSAWTQTSGPDVVLDGPDATVATFTAPSVDADTPLTFRLAVEDPGGLRATTTVTVTVRPVILGQALLGPIVGATVDLFEVATADRGPILTATTEDADDLTQAGRFRFPAGGLDPDALHVIRVSGGMDVDADDDGVRDTAPTPLQGRIRLVGRGADLMESRIRVNALTETAFRTVDLTLRNGGDPDRVLALLDAAARRQLAGDIDGDGDVDRADLSRFDPRTDVAAFRDGAERLAQLTTALLAGDDGADLFRRAADRQLATLPVAGRVSAMARAGDRILLALSGSSTPLTASGAAELRVFDTTRVTRPVEIARLELPASTILDLATDGDLALIATSTSGTLVVDLAEPSAPMLVARLPAISRVLDVGLDGAIAYVGEEGAGVSIIDLATPSTPMTLATVDAMDLSALDVRGGLLAVAGARRVDVLDVSDPSAPVLRTFVEDDGQSFVYEPRLSGERLVFLSSTLGPPQSGFVVSIANAELRVHDIGGGSPAPLLGAVTAPNGAVRLRTFEGRAFVATTGEGITVFDAEGGGAPDRLGGIDVDGAIRDLRIDGTGVTVATFSGLRLLDATIAPPTRPIAVVEALTASRGLRVQDGIAFVTEAGAGLQIVDVDDPGAPVVLGSIEPMEGSITPGIPAFAIGPSSGVLLDSPLFPPGNLPRPLPPLAVISPSAPKPALLGSRLLLPFGAGLQVFDVSDPSAPEALGLDTTEPATAVASDDRRTYAGTREGRLFVLAESDRPLAAPTAVTALGASPQEIDLDGDLAVVASVFGIDVLDVSTASPELRSTFRPFEDIPFGRRFTALGTDSGTAYLAVQDPGIDILDGPSRLVVVDLSDPAVPVLRSVTELDAPIEDMIVRNGLLIGTIGQRGLLLVSVVDPGAPRRLGTIDLPGSASALQLTDTALLVTAGAAGLLVLPLPTIDPGVSPFD